MKKLLLGIFLILASMHVSFAQDEMTEDESAEFMTTLTKIMEKEKDMKYQTGKVDLSNGIELKVPKGYKFMGEKDAQYVVTELWGNPADNSIMGLLVQDSFTLLSSDWAFIVSYENSGYVKDEDANDINYDDLLEEMQDGEAEINKERLAAGYPKIHTAGWAAKPFYDASNNILHWAKILEFDDTDTTLNYDVRILGRKGILSLNAVGSLEQLDDIQKHIPDIIHIAKFTDGNAYADFDPSIDKVAAYTIGGLVAGKLLAKAGILALLLKNIKLVILAVVAFFGAFRKRIGRLFGRKEEEDEIDIVSTEPGLQPLNDDNNPSDLPS